jgi:hypothetical protein
MAQVGPGKWDETKVGDDGQAEAVAKLDGQVERRIVHCALRTLHPVNDRARARGWVAWSADGHTIFVRSENLV